jgi:hypothetical protein
MSKQRKPPERDPHESAFAENCEMDLLALHVPKQVMVLEDSWRAFITNPYLARPLWGPWVMHIYAQVKLPREFS